MIPTEEGWYWCTAYGSRRRPVYVYLENQVMLCRIEGMIARPITTVCFQDWNGPIVERQNNFVLGAKVARYEAILRKIALDKTSLADILARDVLREFGVEV